MTSRHYVIFYVIWSHFGVHKATYATRKAEKLKKIQRMKMCHDLVKTWHDFGRPKHAFDIEENVSRWPKRDTICGNPNSAGCYLEGNVSRFNKNVTQFWVNFCAYLSWSLFQRQGLRLDKSKVRLWDYKTARRAISSSFYMFMYVLIPILIMLFVNSIMSS